MELVLRLFGRVLLLDLDTGRVVAVGNTACVGYGNSDVASGGTCGGYVARVCAIYACAPPPAFAL